MDGKSESVRQARESFDRALRSQTYTEIIRDDRQKEILLDMLDGGVYNRILDIGTGTGYLAFALAKAYPHALVCGIDIAQGIMEENRRRARSGGFSNLVFQTFDGLAYPFEDGTFDLIVSRYAFHHFPDPGIYLLIRRLPLFPGFSFGFLTFGLFLGFLPAYLELPTWHNSSMMGCVGSVVSLVILLAVGGICVSVGDMRYSK